jgi:hypothetical protein
MTPKSRTVLPDLPANIVSTTVSQSRLEFMLGLAGTNAFRRKEPREMLPDDFVGRKAEDAFCACVPTKDMTVKSDEKNCIFLRIGGEQSKPLFHFLRGEADRVI